jgi:hypothetical protein
LKTAALILLFVLVGECFFYSSFFMVGFIKSKIAAADKIAAFKAGSINTSSFLKVPVNSLDKDQPDEVWYRKQLYDVVKRDTLNSDIYVYLLQDDREQELIAENYSYFQTEHTNFQNADFINARKNSIYPRWLDHHYLRSARNNIERFISYYCLTGKSFCLSLHCTVKQVLVPPPKYLSFFN